MRHAAEGLFGVVERAVLPLLEGIARPFFQLFQADALLLGQGVVLAHEDVHVRFEQRVEGQVGIFEGLGEHALVEAVQVQDADFAAEGAHVLDDLGGGALAQHEFVLVGLAAFRDLDEGFHAEGVVLGGNRQAQLVGDAAVVAAFKQVGALDYLARVGQ